MNTVDHERVKQLLPILSDAAIGREVGCTRERVRQLRHKYKIPRPKKIFSCSVNALSEDDMALILKMLSQGEHIQTIADKVNKTTRNLYGILRKKGILMQDFPRPIHRISFNKPQNQRTTNALKKAKFLKSQNYNCFQIHKLTGVSLRTPYMWRDREWL